MTIILFLTIFFMEDSEHKYINSECEKIFSNISKMSVDKFGRISRDINTNKFGGKTINKNDELRGPPGIGFKRTSDGDYDLQNKRLTNISVGKHKNDAINKGYMEAKTTDLKKMITKVIDAIPKTVEQHLVGIKRSLENNSTKIEGIIKSTPAMIDSKISPINAKANANGESIIKIFDDTQKNKKQITDLSALIINDIDKQIDEKIDKKLAVIRKNIRTLPELFESHRELRESVDKVESLIEKLTSKVNRLHTS